MAPPLKEPTLGPGPVVRVAAPIIFVSPLGSLSPFPEGQSIFPTYLHSLLFFLLLLALAGSVSAGIIPFLFLTSAEVAD